MNLISVYQGAAALECLGSEVEEDLKRIKGCEIQSLHKFCDTMIACGCGISDFDGYYVGYKIRQISKEFDLLRFGDEVILNIELKSGLNEESKMTKIQKQMRQNDHYLRFLKKKVLIFTYVENDGFYRYDRESGTAQQVDKKSVAEHMRSHVVNESIDPDREFVPSNYLVSPFNSTEKFIDNAYFLTGPQEEIKKEIFAELEKNSFKCFSISANAGTGKTLLLYDMAKSLMESKKKVVLIHCGTLNEGQEKLNEEHGWEIHAIRAVVDGTVAGLLEGCFVLMVDEAQRIRGDQLRLMIKTAVEKNVPIIFCYDVKQYLRENEGRDIDKYFKENFPQIPILSKKLTTKIRTNKEMASFITNLFSNGRSCDNTNYENVSIEYLTCINDLKKYIYFLEKKGWMSLTYTTSQYKPDPYDELMKIGRKNAHKVIGQEFSKVVIVMDTHFRYNELNQLEAAGGYYSAEGMLYQNVTRVIDELKIIVLSNPELYLRLLKIKNMNKGGR